MGSWLLYELVKLKNKGASMAASKNIILYLLGGETALGKKKVAGFFGGHGYTYDVDEKGKKKLAKDVPTTTGYFVSGSNQNVVLPVDVVSLMIAGSKDFLSATFDGLRVIFETVLGDEDIKNICIIAKYSFLEKLLTVDLNKIKEKENKYGKLEFFPWHYEQLEELQSLYNKVLERSKVIFDYDKSVEGGLGMKTAGEQSGTAEVCTVWGHEPEQWMVFTPQKEFWSPETDFNKIVSASRWYFNTTEGGHFEDEYAGYRRYDFGKLDKKKYYGKATPDITYGSLFTQTPIQLLDKLYKFAKAKVKNPKGLMMAGDLQYVKSKAVGRLIDSYPGAVKGKDIIMPFNVGGKDEPTLIELIDPPGLSYRIADTFDDIAMIFDAFLKKDENNAFGKLQKFIDITDRIFAIEVNGKGVKKLKMNPDFKQSTLSIKVEAEHSKAVKKVPLHLGVNFDIPNRNAFNSVSDPEAKVWINVEESDEKCLRYRCIVTADDWVYIHTAGNANVRVLNLSELGK